MAEKDPPMGVRIIFKQGLSWSYVFCGRKGRRIRDVLQCFCLSACAQAKKHDGRVL